MKKFKIFVYSGEPRLGALPCSEHRVIAEIRIACEQGDHGSPWTVPMEGD